ncbi:MAG: protein translocase subunit SecF [Paracoccaceae bacterium]
MAWRLRLVPEKTNYDFFRWQKATFGGSILMSVLAIAAWAIMGLNFGIDFRGGTTLRTQSTQVVDVGVYREALAGLGLGDVVITEVYDPTFDVNQHVASIRIAGDSETQSVPAETIVAIEAALQAQDPALTIASVESVGAKVSGELIWAAILSMIAATACILVYIWLRFEWQYSVGAVAALVHDIFITIGVFAVFQIKFDLAIIAALLTILGYSINDTVVVFDRLRENLIKYKTVPLRDVMNLTVNETLSRTLMTSGTTIIALIAMLIFGGDVIRGFVFAILVGVILGTYSSVYVAKNIVLFIGLDRSGPKNPKAQGQFANIDA